MRAEDQKAILAIAHLAALADGVKDQLSARSGVEVVCELPLSCQTHCV